MLVTIPIIDHYEPSFINHQPAWASLPRLLSLHFAHELMPPHVTHLDSIRGPKISSASGTNATWWLRFTVGFMAGFMVTAKADKSYKILQIPAEMLLILVDTWQIYHVINPKNTTTKYPAESVSITHPACSATIIN